MIGPSSRRCGSDRKWEGPEPVCREIDCRQPGPLINGIKEGRRTSLGSVIQFRCNEGMTFVGPSNSTTCMENGLWSHPVPQCMESCLLPLISHGKVQGHSPGFLIPHGTSVNVTCDDLYENAETSTEVTCFNGSLVPQVPFCRPASCRKMPEKPRNGLVIAPKLGHGMKAVFKCLDGFRLVGNNMTTCVHGNWTMDSPPVCHEIYCPFPGSLINGRVLLVGHMGLYDYRPYVKKVPNKKQIAFECDKGFYAVGPAGATCVDGHWSPDHMPRCLPASHPTFTWTV